MRSGNTSGVSWFRYCSFSEKYVSVILFGNEKVEIEKRSRCDNSIVVENVHSINSVTKARRFYGLLDSNRAESGTNHRLDLSHITDPVNILDEVAKTTNRKKLILLLARDIAHAIGDKDGNVLMGKYPLGKQYLASPETKEGRGYMKPFERRRSGAGSGQMLEGCALLLIRICIMEENAQIKGILIFC